jgi:hypothetical protein
MLTWYKLWSSYYSHNCFKLCLYQSWSSFNHYEIYYYETHLQEPLKLVQWIHIPYHSNTRLLVSQFTVKNFTNVIWETTNKYLSNKFNYIGNSSHLAKLHSAVTSWKTISWKLNFITLQPAKTQGAHMLPQLNHWECDDVLPGKGYHTDGWTWSNGGLLTSRGIQTKNFDPVPHCLPQISH